MNGTRWICPRCGRSFGRANRPHTCAPALSLDAYFAGRPPAQRRVFDAVAAHVRELDGVEIEAVSVGILIKASRTFAELRPRRDRLALSLLLGRMLDHPRVRRHVRAGARGVAHFIDLHDTEDVDDEVRGWLTEAYLGASR
ncbi:MAG TPA: DUF5655 domain-containing protein [Dehalococcoidia bacterium]|nr:DUF5655 domain-containing protein [Dehalococcoidia bacterium]